MNAKAEPPRLWTPPPANEMTPAGRPRFTRGHKELPSGDEAVGTTFIEFPQAMLLTTSIAGHLYHTHPNGRFLIGQDSYIYFDDANPPTAAAIAPDWFYVPGVPPLLDGQLRRSYVLWRELVPPVIVIEFVSDDGREERDRTPGSGKFWTYEQGVRAGCYAIFDPFRVTLEVFRLIGCHYEPVAANERGHFPVEPLGVELGLWRGRFMNMDITWLRWWDAGGNLLLTPAERLAWDRGHIERMAAKLRELGIDPDSVGPPSQP